MLNTWGDRGQDGRIGHDFALAELDRAAEVGVSHFQLDDGWQAGRSSNSATPGGSLDDIWRRDDYWAVHPQRFPQGLGPVVARAAELGVELCLWFNPAREGGYANWRRDAGAMVALHHAHGVRTFKIDGVDLPSKAAETNLRSMFDAVLDATGGAAAFNLDATSGRRTGYHRFAEYGTVFLENRYTDWGNYHPHWALRTLWQLSHHVPPQRLQVEFLNVARNPGRYPPLDPLAPANVPIEYAFAVTMTAQPLAWMEATGLSADQVARLAPLVKTYRAHQAAIHAGHTFPILAEPDGRSWSGLASLRPDGGYLAVYREWCDDDAASCDIPGLSAPPASVERVLGDGECAPTGVGGGVRFRLPGRHTFGLFRYAV